VPLIRAALAMAESARARRQSQPIVIRRPGHPYERPPSSAMSRWSSGSAERILHVGVRGSNLSAGSHESHALLATTSSRCALYAPGEQDVWRVAPDHERPAGHLSWMDSFSILRRPGSARTWAASPQGRPAVSARPRWGDIVGSTSTRQPAAHVNGMGAPRGTKSLSTAFLLRTAGTTRL